MEIFIICCLLFIYVNMCIFIRGFWVSIRVSGIRGFGFGDGFPPESVSGSGFDFGFRFWVHGDSTRSEPDPLPFLMAARRRPPPAINPTQETTKMEPLHPLLAFPHINFVPNTTNKKTSNQRRKMTLLLQRLLPLEKSSRPLFVFW